MASGSPTLHTSLVAFRLAATRFLSWWLGELATLVPQKLKLWWLEAERVVLMTIGEGYIELFRVTGNRLDSKRFDIAAATVAGTPAPTLTNEIGARDALMIRLSEDQVLDRTITLPLAVEENLRQALGFELDRYTPFRSDQAYFDFRVTDRATDSQRLTVALLVAPKATVDAAVATARAHGLSVVGATLGEDVIRHGNACRNLLPAGARGKSRNAPRFWWRIAVLGLTGLLLAAALLIPIWQKRAAAISLLKPLEEAQAVARDTDALRDRLEKATSHYNLLPNKKWDGQSAIRVLDEVSKRLPDDAFLTQFDYDGTTIQLMGEASSASSLVETLEASALLKEAGFKSQVSKVVSTAADRFHISATLEGNERTRLEAAVEPAPPPVVTPPVAPPADAAPGVKK